MAPTELTVALLMFRLPRVEVRLSAPDEDTKPLILKLPAVSVMSPLPTEQIGPPVPPVAPHPADPDWLVNTPAEVISIGPPEAVCTPLIEPLNIGTPPMVRLSALDRYTPPMPMCSCISTLMLVVRV